MSQRLVYKPPEYVAPHVIDSGWKRKERRSRDPIDRLSRSLNGLCVEATDPYEIVAHLEALGYNSEQALAGLGVDSHFELAHELFERTPRLPEHKRVRPNHAAERFTPLAMGLAFAVTFLLGAYDSTEVLLPAIVVLVWSQAGAALLSRARGEMAPERHSELVSLILWFGVLAVGAAWLPLRFGIDALAPVVVWLVVAALLWSNLPWLALALPTVVGAGLAIDALQATHTPMPHLLALAAGAAFCLPILVRPAWRALGWLRLRLGTAWYPLLYGVGQGVLIVALLRDQPAGANIVPGAVLLLGILLLSQSWYVALKVQLTERLWRDTDPAHYAPRAQGALLLYVAAYLVPTAFGLFVELDAAAQPWLYHWHAFALFGLCLALAVVSFSLGVPAVPGVVFLLAAVAALAGVPFLPLAALTAAAQLLLVLWTLRHVERYAVYLL